MEHTWKFPLHGPSWDTEGLFFHTGWWCDSLKSILSWVCNSGCHKCLCSKELPPERQILEWLYPDGFSLIISNWKHCVGCSLNDLVIYFSASSIGQPKIYSVICPSYYLQHTPMDPQEDLLDRDIPLTVLLPGGQETTAAVHGRWARRKK